MIWTDKPDKEGFWWFKGFRSSRARGFIVNINAPVHVKLDKKYPEITVYYNGSGTVYVLSQHTGKWCYLGDIFPDEQ